MNQKTINSIEREEEERVLQGKRKELLEKYAQKQGLRGFWVAVGKGKKWELYKTFNPNYDLRQILCNEIVIEFDSEDRNFTWEGINFTAINLYRAGYSFEIWNHEGKSPHLHIHDLPISDLTPEKRKLFKKLFIRKYTPKEYLVCADFSLINEKHLIALEWAKHWKGIYEVKRLLHKFNPKEIVAND